MDRLICACAVAAAVSIFVGNVSEPAFGRLESWSHAQDAPESVDSQTSGCADCHNGRGDREGFVTPFSALADSVHNALECTDCHAAISMEALKPQLPRPHGDARVPVDCGECHEDETEAYEKHGRLQVGTDPDMPTCAHCHGMHDIFPSTDRRSHVHPVNLPSTCRACHTDVDLVKKHDVLRDAPIKIYQNSVHGRPTRKGIYANATCADCHSTRTADGGRTSHRILSPADPDSTIFHFSIPDTCGRCHVAVTRDYWDGIHGKLVKRGSVDSPVCTHCHGEHGIISPNDPRSPVSAARLAEETCAPCHESPVLNLKYADSSGRHASYIDAYHGLKTKAGDVTVATCDNCHGSHRILPADDPTSSIHPDNLQSTCGECHESISPQVAQSRIHETPTAVPVGWPAFFRKLYIVLIVATIGGMLLHNCADWFRYIRRTAGRAFVQRLSINEVAQHWVLMISFTVLVISGFSLRFSEAGWVKMLFGWQGGFEMRGLVHRVAAVVMTCGSVWHVLYLFTSRGRHCLWDMLPRKRDVTDLWQNILYFLGVRDGEPHFARFSYMEKAEYWALAWGTVLMTVTGVLLWFENAFVTHWQVPGVVLEVGLVIHYYEAWLAFLAILVWHIYGTVFKPAVYPMNPACLKGTMPKAMYTHEHPEGPKLKSRTISVHLEDEEEDPADQPEGRQERP